MAKYQLSKTVYELLLKQLVSIEDRRRNSTRFNDKYDSQNELIKLQDAYEYKLRKLIESSVQTDSNDNSVPFVLIGCEVDVYDIDSEEMTAYRIVNTTVFDLDENHVTFISPIGKALLFKKIGDQVSVKIPVGDMRYEIKAIRLHNIKIDFNY